MTERQRAGLLQAYVALAFIMAGSLLHAFLTNTLVNVPSAEIVAAGVSSAAPCSISSPKGVKPQASFRLSRTSNGGNDPPAAKASASDCWAGGDSPQRLCDDGARTKGCGARDAYSPRAPPAVA
jgi:hypothetical protein